MVDLERLTTEARNPETMALDTMTPLEIAQAMNAEDACAVSSVTEVLPQVATAIEWASDALARGGRLVYIGAGTSGRLGVLDAAECVPTFSVPPDVVVGVIAGGREAMFSAVEGAEDDGALAERDLAALSLGERDLVVGLAASGRTPYVLGGLSFARGRGCRTVAVACNRGSQAGALADLAIEPVPGPEVLTGSTRLKAGTVQKLVLNMISTGCMVRLGKAYQNLMVDVQPTNEKLVTRSQGIVMAACECSRAEAASALEAAGGRAKTAIVMLLTGSDADEADRRLARADGHVRQAIE